ncbi:MAG: hypothetical protein ACRD0K_00090 [Egibacteraceae bacterium]
MLERQGHAVDALTLDQTQLLLREALSQPDLANLATPDPAATPGALARTALAHLARRDADTRQLVEQAIAVAPPAGQRADPATLAIGALVLLAFHAEITLERDPAKGWSFRFHTKPLRNSTIGKLLGKLMGVCLHLDE